MQEKLPDIQNTKIKSIAINRVGVTKVDFPIRILDGAGNPQTVCAEVNMYGSLPKTQRGTNMSRFIEVLMEFKETPFNEETMKAFLQKLTDVVITKDMYADITFKYFIEKEAPVTKKKGPLGYDCTLAGRLIAPYYIYWLKIVVPVTSVCPCSKGMSKYGAHNQRGHVTVQMQFEQGQNILIEDLVKLVEGEGSCPLYSLLKRKDEKYVTEYAYRNAKFVEDISRDVALRLQKRAEIKRFKVKVENFESIHNHNAVAYVFRARKGNGWTSYNGGEF